MLTDVDCMAQTPGWRRRARSEGVVFDVRGGSHGEAQQLVGKQCTIRRDSEYHIRLTKLCQNIVIYVNLAPGAIEPPG